ncbi:hypothetical protein A6U97_02600 [Agrobacterium tumefaciens]|uniref:hypothetical protein n=1 Tax=Agrobacterium tumefaciens TaxID=358 RepID=UPI00080F89AB|nr:hypothetical protein A6U97_02600 [Agrobacterium tumefaciens]
MTDVDSAALEAVEAIFGDIRGRAVIKWLFDAHGSEHFIAKFDDGEELRGIDLEVQGQIKATWQKIIAEGLSKFSRPTGWRCFHCDEVFFTANDARLHFGMDQCSDPACKIKMGAEKSLLVALRRAETELQDAWAAIHNENTEAAKAYYAQQSRHGEQLRAAEELGFERGIKDSTAHIAALEEQALRDRKLRDEAQQDALLWKYSVATDDHPPLLVTIWNQRKEVLGALHDLCEAYAACNGEDHAAYIRARAAISGQLQPDPPPSALANAANDLASWAGCINWRGGENQKDWLDELRQHIESVQALCKPYLPKSEATP